MTDDIEIEWYGGDIAPFPAFQAYVEMPDGCTDELYVAQRIPEKGIWYWATGDSTNLDDRVGGWVLTKEDAMRYCELVTQWRYEAKAAS